MVNFCGLVANFFQTDIKKFHADLNGKQTQILFYFF